MMTSDGQDGQDLVRRIKDLLDIVDVVGSYIELKKSGARYVALCPFHAEKAPSFNVNKVDQFYHCFGCKKSGDIFDFVMAMESVSFPEALKILGDRCGVRVERERVWQKGPEKSFKTRLYKVLEAACSHFEKNLQAETGAQARQYLLKRRFPPDAFLHFRLGFAPESWRELLEALTRRGFPTEDLLRAGLVKKSESGRVYDLFRNRLMIPIFDMQGRVVGFGGRVLDQSEPKYINSPETEIFRKHRLLYGLNRARQAITQNNAVVVMEGYTDVLMAHFRGAANSVATLGTALTEEHARLIRRMTDRVFLLFDGDSAGKAAAERGVEILLANDLDVTVVPLEGGTDPCDFFRENDSRAFWGFVEERGRDFFDFAILELMSRYDKDTPGGRSRIARGLFRLVAALGDPIKQDLSLRRIAEALDIREDLLRREFLKGERKGDSPGAPPIADRKPQALSGTRVRAENDLLYGLLKEPALVDKFRQVLCETELEDADARSILGLLLDEETPAALTPRELLSRVGENESAKSRVIALLSEERRAEPGTLAAAALEYLGACSAEQEYRRLRDRAKESHADKDLSEMFRSLKEKDKRSHRALKRDESI